MLQRPENKPYLAWSLLLGIIFSMGVVGCEKSGTGPDGGTEGTAVVFRVQWPTPSLDRTATIPEATTDISIRLATADGAHEAFARITKPDTQVTVYVAPGSGYEAEAVCAGSRREPLGYGITKDLTLMEGINNNVSVDIEPFYYHSVVRPDTVVVGDSLRVEFQVTIGRYFGDMASRNRIRYCADADFADTTGYYGVDALLIAVDENDDFLGYTLPTTEDSMTVRYRPSPLVTFDQPGSYYFWHEDTASGPFSFWQAHGYGVRSIIAPFLFGDSGECYWVEIIGGAQVSFIIRKHQLEDGELTP